MRPLRPVRFSVNSADEQVRRNPSNKTGPGDRAGKDFSDGAVCDRICPVADRGDAFLPSICGDEFLRGSGAFGPSPTVGLKDTQIEPKDRSV